MAVRSDVTTVMLISNAEGFVKSSANCKNPSSSIVLYADWLNVTLIAKHTTNSTLKSLCHNLLLTIIINYDYRSIACGYVDARVCQ